jgi:hypothetical protein
MPALVAGRPRDERGYPVPAITPWEDGVPQFAATGTARTYICAVERRCSICATPMAVGPVWRVVGGAEADAIDEAVAAGRPYVNNAATVEAPGHRLCMLYAAVVCPYLARPTARRGQGAALPGHAAVKGDPRGEGGALAGFSEVEYRYSDTVLFRFRGLCEYRRHDLGEDQLPLLLDALAHAPRDVSPAPAYLMDDESAAVGHFLDISS